MSDCKSLSAVAEQKSEIDRLAQMKCHDIELAFKILISSLSPDILQKTVGELVSKVFCCTESFVWGGVKSPLDSSTESSQREGRYGVNVSCSQNRYSCYVCNVFMTRK